MEEWDAYTVDGKKTGQTIYRGRRIPSGLFHMVCEVLLRHSDGSYLCMKRDESKPIHPGSWEVTAGGSALKGEEAAECAARELKEETGLSCPELHLISRTVWPGNRCIFFSYWGVYDGPKDAVVLQEGETSDYRWISEEEFAKFVRSGEMIKNQRKRCAPYLEEYLK